MPQTQKRKDNKGRILRTGESQRKDLRYQYRYTDNAGVRHTIYANDLHQLREREEAIKQEVQRGINYNAGKETVSKLVDRYIATKPFARRTTKQGYSYVSNLLKRENFGSMQIKDVKLSDAKQWVIDLYKNGLSSGTIKQIKCVVEPAFQLAHNDEIIARNPFDFKIGNIIPCDAKKRTALTSKQREKWLEFIRNDGVYKKYYYEFVVLLGTGMRVSEFCGLTKHDIDFENRRIYIGHQLRKDGRGDFYIERPKTESGERFIPMSDEVYEGLQNIIANRQKPKSEPTIDGYSEFILLNNAGKPKTVMDFDNEMRWAYKRYMRLHEDAPLPKITPHILRHTFCTSMANAGMDAKVLQYLMGHSKIDVTMNVYTHINYDLVETQMLKVITPQESKA